MKITLEIGSNLKEACIAVAKEVAAGGGIYHGDIGTSISQAFGINFSKAFGEVVLGELKTTGVLPSGRNWKLTVE